MWKNSRSKDKKKKLMKSIPMSFIHELPFCHHFFFGKKLTHTQHPSKDRALPVNISTCCSSSSSSRLMCVPFYVAHSVSAELLHIKLASLLTFGEYT